MVNGYLKFGRVEAAQRLFLDMQVKDVAAWNAMVHGYFENGRVEEGVRLFDEMPVRDVISWTSMIGGLDLNGKSEEALFVFKKMLSSGVEPTWSTFACVLSACANAVEFNLGFQVHGHVVKLGCCFHEFISASLITFYANCMKIEDAHKIFNETLTKNVVKWTALLTGYVWNNKNQDALSVFGDMTKMGVLPNQSTFSSTLNACCGLEALDKDRSHPLSERIYEKLDWLGKKLKEVGHVPDKKFALHDVEDEQKEEMLSFHSERLAIAFGLVSTVEGSTITVMKNLRVCGDCHSVIKLISKIVGRKIVVRDSGRFHHFKNGICTLKHLYDDQNKDFEEEEQGIMQINLSLSRTMAVAQMMILKKDEGFVILQINLSSCLPEDEFAGGAVKAFRDFDSNITGSFMRVNAHPNDSLRKNSHRLSQVTGLDLDCGAYYPDSLQNAVMQGEDHVCSDEHIEVAAEAAREGLFFLKMKFNSRDEFYIGVPCRYATPLDDISSYGEVIYEMGCGEMACWNDSLIFPATEAAKKAGVTMLLMGFGFINRG
ncbi:hypothetical protein OIU78_018137 [Salix suchowensis]|nr:hypothetical protein OIU78_018137 [Salix suchowensis]